MSDAEEVARHPCLGLSTPSTHRTRRHDTTVHAHMSPTTKVRKSKLYVESFTDIILSLPQERSGALTWVFFKKKTMFVFEKFVREVGKLPFLRSLESVTSSCKHHVLEL